MNAIELSPSHLDPKLPSLLLSAAFPFQCELIDYVKSAPSVVPSY